MNAKRKSTGSRGLTGRRWLRGIGMTAVVFVLAAAVVLGARHYINGASRPVGQTSVIGGPFSLIDHNGQPRTDADFRGQYMLIYFGYTFCPDVCPTSLTRNAEALDILGDAGDPIVPILITVDPARDTPEHLRDYVDFFHPRMVALTGDQTQTDAAVRAYRAYYKKVEEEGGDPDVYLIDHTSITYLMGPDGEFVQHFSHALGAEEMAERLRQIL